MPVSVVVGGQFGSEGKGKVAHYLARTMQAEYVIRCGGTNSGHTVIDENGKLYSFRQLPTAAILPNVKLILCPGSYIDLDILHEEVSRLQLSNDRLLIDEKSVIITSDHKKMEEQTGLISSIASTGSGTGAAVVSRIMRKKTIFAKDIPSLRPFITNTSEILNDGLKKNSRIILEGTQGFGLSILHSEFYPNVTSRDTTAAAFIAEAGLSPFDIDDIALVIRSYPIRVGGDSGPLPHEISWDEVTSIGCHARHIQEFTTVTKKLRRVARFDPKIVKMAINANKPTKIFLNHIDYVHKNIENDENLLSNYLSCIEKLIGRRIDYLGFSKEKIHVRK